MRTTMGRLLSRIVIGMVAGGFTLAGAAAGQVTPAESVLSPAADAQPSGIQLLDAQPSGIQPADAQPSNFQPSKESTRPPDDISETSIDPASLLPDLPPLPKAKASLIGGTIGRLDRVRDQITVQ